MEIILIRHGQTEHNRKRVFQGSIDTPLNDEGIKQAELIKSALAGEIADIIFTSSLKRAVDTAQIISGSMGNPPIYKERDLREIDFGLFEGLTYHEICEKYPHEAKKLSEEALNYHFPEGESITDFFIRIKEFFYRLLLEDYEKVVVVTHEGCIRAMLSCICVNSIDLFWKYSVNTGSISRVHGNKDFSYIISLNERNFSKEER